MTPRQRFLAARWGYVAIILLATLTQLHFSPDLLAAGALLVAAVVAGKGARSYLGLPTFLPAGAYGGAVLCEALTPLFGPAPLPWTAGGPVGRLYAALQSAGPISFDTLPLVDLLLFAPAGFLVVMLLRERGSGARWGAVAGAGAGLALVAELGHGMLGFPIWWGAVLVRAAAVMPG